MKERIIAHFAQQYREGTYVAKDDFSEVVTCAQNFDDLLIPKDHPSRDLSDTYFLDAKSILRPQTSVTLIHSFIH